MKHRSVATRISVIALLLLLPLASAFSLQPAALVNTKAKQRHSAVKKARLKSGSATIKHKRQPQHKHGRINRERARKSAGRRVVVNQLRFPVLAERPVTLSSEEGNIIRLSALPRRFHLTGNQYTVTTETGDKAVLTLRPDVQQYVEQLVEQAQAPHIAVVVIQPSTGRILGIGRKSVSLDEPLLHADFPAASLFKVVTSATALEQSSLEPDSLVPFRGGTYELERWNYLPNPGRDRRSMTLSEALGKSCNAVFGRVAGIYLKPPVLFRYASNFGFNSSLGFEVPTEPSRAVVPTDDYLLSRTGAGFGDVSISPIHAAALMAGLGNLGVMPRPQLVDRAVIGNRVITNSPEMLRRMISPKTADELLGMMVTTTVSGTSRKDFMDRKRPVLGSIAVAAKTGTLHGDDPNGINHWFIGAAPKDHPQIAVAIISVDPRNATGRPARIGRMIFDKFVRGARD